MKVFILRTSLFVALLFVLNTSKAQWVSIPDTAFASYLQSTFPACMNGNLMDTICSGQLTSPMVFCSHRPIKDLTGIQYFDSLMTLNCSYDSLQSLPPLASSLRMLLCSFNELTLLPDLPDSLLELDCNNNMLTSLPPLPNLLNIFDCSYNRLTGLPALPHNLVQFFCNDNLLTSLPTLPIALKNLRCYDNQLGSLPLLPNKLGELICGNNQLTSLPALGDSLYFLDFSRNQVIALPSLPNSLSVLYCGSNQLTNITTLPLSLKVFQCADNQFTSLPILPDSLEIFNCNVNNLITLPTLPNSLNRFYCSSNLLTEIPELPDSLYEFFCSNNPNITCLPQLKKVKKINFSNTGITCLPNYPQSNTFSNPSLTSISLCTPFNANGCEVYWNINGKVYNDTSGNCVKDAGETNVQNMKVNLYQNGVLAQQNYSGGYGVYSFDTDMGTYTMTVDTAGVPFDILCPASRFDTSVITTLDSFDYDKDFALQCKPGFDVGAWSLVSTSVFRPANMAYVNVHAGDWAEFWGQNCNTNNLSGQVVTTISGAATFVSATAGALSPTVLGSTLTYNISNWSAVNPNTDFNIIVQTDTTAALGSQICFDVNVTPINGDNNPANNILTHCFTVVGSYDPNIKEVYPAGNIDTATKWLTYTIHFQNTGTAEAQHIYLTDTLDSNIDAASFQLLAYSHQPMVQLKGNNLRFNFPNINLPDSNTNEALSHGYVQYKVKLKDNLPIGTNITNTAFIYFDFNAPVVTNTTSNTIALATGVTNIGFGPDASGADFGLNPNPATESFAISIDETMLGSKLSLTDMTGREILHSAVQIQSRSIGTQFDIRTLSQGVYFVSLECKTGKVTKKLMIQR